MVTKKSHLCDFTIFHNSPKLKKYRIFNEDEIYFKKDPINCDKLKI